jgi:hypothetical protein
MSQGRRGARCGRGRSGGRHRRGRGRCLGTLVPGPRNRRRRRLRDGRLSVLDCADERARRGRRSGRRSLCRRRCRCGRGAGGGGRLRRLRSGARRAVRTACERRHTREPESKRKHARADERYAPGTRPAAGLIPGDLAATLPVGNRRSVLVRRERFTGGCGCWGNGHASSVPHPSRPLNGRPQRPTAFSSCRLVILERPLTFFCRASS